MTNGVRILGVRDLAGLYWLWIISKSINNGCGGLADLLDWLWGISRCVTLVVGISRIVCVWGVGCTVSVPYTGKAIYSMAEGKTLPSKSLLCTMVTNHDVTVDIDIARRFFYHVLLCPTHALLFS